MTKDEIDARFTALHATLMDEHARATCKAETLAKLRAERPDMTDEEYEWGWRFAMWQLGYDP